MSEKMEIISNSTKFSYCKIEGMSLLDFPELADCGISACGEAEQGTPYQMLRAGGSEKQHTTLWFMLEGTMTFMTGKWTFEAPPGSLMIQDSAMDRNCVMESGVFRHVFLTLPGVSHTPGVIPAQYTGEIRALLKMLRRERFSQNRDTHRPQLLAELLNGYVRQELSREENPFLLDNAVKLIESDIRRPWTTSTLAEKLKLSPSGLYLKCMKHFGFPPKTLVAKLKFQRAQSLLFHTNMKLNEIAREIGYGNAYAFSKAFRKQTGMPPGAVRKK